MTRNLDTTCMKEFLTLFFLIFLSACATHAPQGPSAATQGVMKGYLSQIKKFDGINEHEAILLAQSQLMFQGLDEEYYYNHPRVEEESAESFLVVFDPINKTLAETQTDTPIEIIVSKKDGSVRLK